ncbi:hypothetical protein [Candidatus Coxiella mudrowiae]|uniref:hypothetical protein n=1 Tax=Candidatus Coxiella mudrowiae TaxID=2054173 RepID=UPI001F27A885|nr:hypothetical protein [Candidatus Coxiella mudrowiae]
MLILKACTVLEKIKKPILASIKALERGKPRIKLIDSEKIAVPLATYFLTYFKNSPGIKKIAITGSYQ